MKLKFKGRVLLSILLPVIVIIGAIQYYAYSVSAEILIEKSEQEMSGMAVDTAKFIEQQIHEDETLLNLIANYKLTKDVLQKGTDDAYAVMTETIDLILADNKRLETIALLNQSGITVVSSS